MPRGLMSLKSTGLKELIKEMKGLDKNFHEIAKKSLKARQDVVLKQMQINWRTLVGGTPGGFVDSSFGQSTKKGEKEPNSVVGTVGVYHLDVVYAKFAEQKSATKGKTTKRKRSKQTSSEKYAQAEKHKTKKPKKKPMNAPQIAYWVEFGSQRLRSGLRKQRGQQIKDEELAKAVDPKPFISNALYYTMEEQEAAFKAEFNRLADQYR